ncbi:hypothetical protein HZS_6225, partial [Henneguya salminicola]
MEMTYYRIFIASLFIYTPIEGMSCTFSREKFKYVYKQLEVSFPSVESNFTPCTNAVHNNQNSTM